MELSKEPELESSQASELANEARLKPLTTAKKRRVDNPLLNDFERELKKMNEWFDETESTLMLLISESSEPQEQFTEDERRVLVQVRVLQ